MNWQNMWQLAKSDYLKLVPILAFAFYVTFIPHMNYPYPVHIDEWVHLAHSNAIIQARDIAYLRPFSGESIYGITSNLELGFRLFWAVFHWISGISWLTTFRYFPSIVFVITVLSVYTLARREGFGWEAALCTCLIPTTVGILGPAFLVPVAMGLLFLPLSLFLVFNFKTFWSYLVLFLFTCFLLSMHATTAVGLVIIFIPYILLNLKGNFKHALGMILALAIPFVALFPWVFGQILGVAENLFTPHFHSSLVQLPRILQTYGYIPVCLCLLGILFLAIRGGKKGYGLILGLLILLLMLAAYFALHYGFQPLYTRGLMYMMLIMSVVAGAGLMAIKSLRLPERLGVWLRVPLVTQNVGRFLCLAIIVGMLFISIPEHQDTRYYHMIDRVDYESFVWIKDNVDSSYTKAIVDPWKATAFTAISGKCVYTRIHERPYDIDKEAYAFIQGGSTDTAFLRENGISIIYTRVYGGDKNTDYESDNPDLVKLAPSIYLLQESQ